MATKTKKTKIDLSDPIQRAGLSPRKSPYSQPMNGRGNAVLFYVGATGSRWGIRTVNGDRVIGDESEMSYGDVCNTLAAILDAEKDRGIKVVNLEATANALTFGAAWDAYVDTCAAEGKTATAMRTINSYGSNFTGICDMLVATTPLPVLNKHFRDLVGTPVQGKRLRTVNSVAKAKSAMKTALRAAGVNGPWQDLKAKVSAKRKAGEAVPLMEGQRYTFLAHVAAEDPAMHVYVTVLALTGARPGEIAQVRVKDVQDEMLRIPDGKTGKRAFAMTPDARAYITALAAGRDGDELLVPGGPWSANRCRYVVARAVEAAGVPGATLYSLRHGFITEALYADVPILSVAKACGTSVAMIEATYGHAIAARETAVWARMGKAGHLLEVV